MLFIETVFKKINVIQWPDRALSMGHIELFDCLNCVQTNDLY